MKKRLFSMFLAIVMVLSLLPATALAGDEDVGEDSGTQVEDLIWSLDEAGVLTISGEGAMADYTTSTVPWRGERDSIRSVVVSDGVTSLGSNAFYNCKKLTEVTLPNSIETIGSSAFCGCRSLTAVSIPGKVTEIADRVFQDCFALQSVTLPNGVVKLGDSAFSGCKALEMITLPDGIQQIGDSAFSGCTALNTITFPDSVKQIDDYAFSDCESLKTVTISGNMEKLGDDVFDNCEALSDIYYGDTEIVWLLLCRGAQIPATFHYAEPTGRTAASGSCGVNGDNLTWVLTDDGHLSIVGGGAMNDYSAKSPAPWYNGRAAISEITLGDNVPTIGAQAFLGCSKLESITIPEGITVIGDRAFSGCDHLREIYYNAAEAADLTADSAVFSAESATDSLKLICSDTVKKLPAYLFSDCANLTEILFTGTAPAIGENTFGDITATARYPYGDATWTKALMDACGEHITWKVYSNAPITDCECVAPDKISYMPGEALDTTGLGLTLIHSDGCREDMEAAADDLTLGDYDMTLSGWQQISVSCGEYKASFSIYIHNTKVNVLSAANYPESQHNYADNLDSTYTCKEDGALSLTVTFSAQTDLGDDNLYINDTAYTGTELAGQTITVSGDTLTIRLVSDDADNAYGFAIDKITAVFPVHEYDKAEIVAPTCEEAGYTAHTCLCGACYRDNYTSALNHDFGDWAALNDAQHQRVCKNDPSHVETADHIWNNGQVTKDPTETETGVRTYTCITCGATTEETIPALGHKNHSYTATETKPTCEKAGYTTYTCACGDSYVDDYTSALDHDWDNGVVTRKATEAKAGVKTYTCSRCDATRTEEIPQLPHKHHYAATKVIAPTYTTEGYTRYECTCGDSYTDKPTEKLTLAKPTISSIANTSDSIKVTWNKITGATGYQVWRKSGSNEWKLVKTINDASTTSYTNTGRANGTKYQYKVRAIAKVDGKIVNTGSFSGIKTMYRLSRPTISSKKSPAAGKITLKWGKNSKVTGYQIKYVLGDTSKTVRVKGADTLSKTISGLSKGKTYKVYVRSYKTVDSKTYYSAYSAYKSVTVAK